MPIVSIRDLSVTYKDNKRTVTAVDNVSLELDNNSINVVIGQSGSGKTSLLKAIGGLIPYEGEILVNGREFSNLRFGDKNIAYVSQEYSLYPHKTVFDNIAMPLIVAHIDKKEIVDRVYQIAKEMELFHCLNKLPSALSGGQQQRVALARGLVKRPSICLMDEPLSNTDMRQRSFLRSYIKDSALRYYSTVIYVTHDIDEAFSLADRVIVMDNGRIIANGDPQDVLKTYGTQFVRLNGAE